MSWKRNTALTAVSGGGISVVALLTGVPSAQADELAGLRTNQALLPQTLDQPAQAPGPRSSPLYRSISPPRTPTRSLTTIRAASTATSRASARATPPSAAC